jgi:hypothetical protein
MYYCVVVCCCVLLESVCGESYSNVVLNEDTYKPDVFFIIIMR